MKGISKWLETAMRPVPERSHILKTWPTKVGPLPLDVEFIPAILIFPGNGDEVDSIGGGGAAEDLTAAGGGGRGWRRRGLGEMGRK